jgi:hypothetical protein
VRVDEVPAQLTAAEALPSNHPDRPARLAFAEDLAEAHGWAAKTRCRACTGPAAVEIAGGVVRIRHAFGCSAPRPPWRAVGRAW